MSVEISAFHALLECYRLDTVSVRSHRSFASYLAKKVINQWYFICTEGISRIGYLFSLHIWKKKEKYMFCEEHLPYLFWWLCNTGLMSELLCSAWNQKEYTWDKKHFLHIIFTLKRQHRSYLYLKKVHLYRLINAAHRQHKCFFTLIIISKTF